jgi:hypothetical protein
MTDKTETVPAPLRISLDRWLGRREALGMIAGRCSAADVECLRQIRDNKLHQDVSGTWEEFCNLHLGCSRRNVDRAIRHLNEHGPAFFHATQMLRLTEAEYVALKEHMTEGGLKLEGETVAWTPENAARLHVEVGKLRAIEAPKPARKQAGFETLVQRLDELVEKAPTTLDDRQRRTLGDVLLRLSNLASRHGIVLLQR